MTSKTQFRLRRLSAVSDAGTPGRPNEDRFVAEERFALVVDGATGLADQRLLQAGESDAAWLAERAAALMAEAMTERADAAPHELVRRTNGALRAELAAALARRGGDVARIEDAPRFALPTAVFQLARLIEGAPGEPVSLEAAGLGDCALIALQADGGCWRATGNASPPGREEAAARSAILAHGPLDQEGGLIRRPGALDQLRRARERHNTPGGPVWTLGVAEGAGDHVRRQRRPVEAGAVILLATDGLANLADLYGAYDAPGLVAAAVERGLPELVEELRRIERVDDPKGARHPRFKQSDDATGVLLQVVEAE